MTQNIMTTAGIDTSKATLDIAVHGRAERWQVVNALPGWRALAIRLATAGVARVGIEATGGDERSVGRHMRAAGFTVISSDRVRKELAGVDPSARAPIAAFLTLLALGVLALFALRSGADAPPEGRPHAAEPAPISPPADPPARPPHPARGCRGPGSRGRGERRGGAGPRQTCTELSAGTTSCEPPNTLTPSRSG